MANPDDRPRPWDALLRASVAPSLLVFLLISLGPHGFRLRSPSLYADDVVRLADLQTSTLGEILFRPFNEHMAPLFQGVSWLTWRLAGRVLARAPLAFTLASFLPAVLTLGLIGAAVRRETRSDASALAAMAVGSLSWLQVETVYWYSASSFMWALLATLLAWLAAAGAIESAGRGPRLRASALGALATAAAPAFSAVGLLAGPVAAVRVLTGTGRRGHRLALALAPVAGTVAYLAVCSAFRYSDVLAVSLERNVDVMAGLRATFVAPVEALLPALAGVHVRPARGLGAVLEMAATAVSAGWLGFWAWRRGGRDRPLVAGGLVLIFGGYGLAFCARAGEPGRSLLETQRYHLFPMLGLIFLLAPALRRGLARADAHPAVSAWAATALAVVLLTLNAPEIRRRAAFFRYPDQAGTLAALDRLGAACARAGVPRAQALAALDPVETKWAPAGQNVLTLLAPGATVSNVPNPQVKPTLLAALTPRDRRAVCGGMDATPYLLPADGPASGAAVSRPVALFRVREAGEGRYVGEGWPSFIEYEFPAPPPADARALGLTGLGPDDAVEVWWRGDLGRWSETRSVRLRPGPGRSWLLPLDRLPHWDRSEARRVRVLFRAPGPIAAAPPRLVR